MAQKDICKERLSQCDIFRGYEYMLCSNPTSFHFFVYNGFFVVLFLLQMSLI